MKLRQDTHDICLRDRRTVRVRPLRPTDRDLYERAVMDLSPRSRYLRFLSPIPRLSESLLDLMTQADGHGHVAYVALTPDETTAIGVVRYVRLPRDPGTAEVAIAVADDWQRLGLGTELLRQTVEHAGRSGVHVLVGTTLRENEGSARLLHAAGFSTLGADGPYLTVGLRQ